VSFLAYLILKINLSVKKFWKILPKNSKMKEVSRRKQLKTLLQQTINLSTYKKTKTPRFYKRKIL
jgi:hypothetical protein